MLEREQRCWKVTIMVPHFIYIKLQKIHQMNFLWDDSMSASKIMSNKSFGLHETRDFVMKQMKVFRVGIDDVTRLQRARAGQGIAIILSNLPS